VLLLRPLAVFPSKPFVIKRQHMSECKHPEQNQRLNQVLGWLQCWLGFVCDQSCSHPILVQVQPGFLTALVQAPLREKSGRSFLPDFAVCACVCVSKAGCLCLLVPKNDELQKYPFGVSHSVKQEGSRKPL